MKLSHKLFIFTFLTIATFSCSEKKVEKSFASEDKKVTLHVSAIQRAAFDPYLTNVNVKGFGHDENLSFEIYSNSLTDADIKMSWVSNSKGKLTIKEGDGNIRKFSFSISDTRITLRE